MLNSKRKSVMSYWTIGFIFEKFFGWTSPMHSLLD